MDDKKNILLITTSFPPVSGSGAQRVVRFCRYLSKNGYELFILTTASLNPKYQMKEVASDICYKVIRVPMETFSDRLRHMGFFKNINNSNNFTIPSKEIYGNKRNYQLKEHLRVLFKGYFEFPDDANTWILAAIRNGNKLAKETTFKCIYSTSPKVSSHIVAAFLARKLKLPWVIEFRDLWVGNPWLSLPQPWPRHYLELWLEKWLVKNANLIVTISSGSKNILIKRHGKKIGQKTVVFSHGFDPGEYPSYSSVPSNIPLVLLHTGYFYNGRRDITGLFRALQCLINENRISKDDVSLWFAGDNDKYSLKSGSSFGLSFLVKDLGNISPAQSLSLQTSAHILLLVEAAEDTDWVISNLPGKLYEYIGANRPILALANPKSALAEIIRETNVGVVFPPGDLQNIGTYIEDRVRDLKANGKIIYEPNETKRAEYNWSKLVRTIRKTLDELIELPQE